MLYSFSGGTDGAEPYAGVVMDAAGNLYGSTDFGGNLNCNEWEGFGCGTVFKLNKADDETVLYSFGGAPDGAKPYAGVVMGAAGNLYSTTFNGGNVTCANTSGCGTVFMLDITGKEKVLYNFSGAPDGANPEAGVVMDAAGNLYGTTFFGGASGDGTVFKLDTAGKETVLYSFSGTPDGANPVGGLVMDVAGNLYGTTEGGGASNNGTVFMLGTADKETVLYSFSGTPDGANPVGGLVMDVAGNLYSTTFNGGNVTCTNASGCGTVFKLDTTGNETLLYMFSGGADGAYPTGGLVMDAAGNLYGTTFEGGDLSCMFANMGLGCGTVFKLTLPSSISGADTTRASTPRR
ncbi:MAG: choice-of-anchor tandem repeat GloVer-containing protein [Terriglobia bacterium]